jgi:L-fucose dehydrogenase
MLHVLAEEGAIPVIVGRSEAEITATTLKITKTGGKCFHIVAER